MNSWYGNRNKEVPFEVLLGKTVARIERTNDYALTFVVSDNERYIMEHLQDCCEDVSIEDICGELEDLLGSQILQAEVSTDDGNLDYGSYTWTYYKLATIKGSVTIRWYGTSNGYYSEEVSLYQVNQ